MSNGNDIFGITAEFETPEALLAAAQATHAAGYRRTDAYSPFPIDGLADHLGFPKTRIPLLVLLGGVGGACLGYFICWYANTISYTWNIGGRPPNSWEAFIPITFELGVLGASLTAVFGMFALNGLPMPYHPMFSVPQFEAASRDRFFLLIEESDPQYDAERTRQFLEELKPVSIAEVPK